MRFKEILEMVCRMLRITKKLKKYRGRHRYCCMPNTVKLIERARVCQLLKITKKLKKCHNCHLHFLPDMVTFIDGKTTCYSCAKEKEDRTLGGEIIGIKNWMLFYSGLSFIVGVILTACIYWVIK